MFLDATRSKQSFQLRSLIGCNLQCKSVVLDRMPTQKTTAAFGILQGYCKLMVCPTSGVLVAMEIFSSYVATRDQRLQINSPSKRNVSRFLVNLFIDPTRRWIPYFVPETCMSRSWMSEYFIIPLESFVRRSKEQEPSPSKRKKIGSPHTDPIYPSDQAAWRRKSANSTEQIRIMASQAAIFCFRYFRHSAKTGASCVKRAHAPIGERICYVLGPRYVWTELLPGACKRNAGTFSKRAT